MFEDRRNLTVIALFTPIRCHRNVYLKAEFLNEKVKTKKVPDSASYFSLIRFIPFKCHLAACPGYCILRHERTSDLQILVISHRLIVIAQQVRW